MSLKHFAIPSLSYEIASRVSLRRVPSFVNVILIYFGLENDSRLDCHSCTYLLKDIKMFDYDSLALNVNAGSEFRQQQAAKKSSLDDNVSKKLNIH